MINDKGKISRKQKISTLLWLVIFIFIILLISIVIAGGISVFLVNIKILPPLSANRFPVLLIFILAVSLLIGTILSILGGEMLLHPLVVLTAATSEIAKGNFDIRVKVRGPREMEALAESFNEMAQELSCTEKMRDDFVSNISHEFKTPVVSIRGFARQLKKNSLALEQREKYLDIIIAETERLTRLSSNMLLLTKLENTDIKIHKNTFFLDEQIRRSILLLEPQISKKELNLDIRLETIQIEANEEILQHVWVNLLENAVKFTPEYGTIAVSLAAVDDAAVFKLFNPGSGLDDETRKRMFDKFYQTDFSRSTEGNGLGLSIVKKIIDFANGSVFVESRLGRGTCFTIRLPLKKKLMGKTENT
ncbi:MAG: HAMP domain-containing sensor histidine kinase [Oscillospiraceae bacterium]|jgi:signal transduction histidine kinase